MSFLITWAMAIRAIWNKPLRQEMMRSGEFIASHLQMIVPHLITLEYLVDLFTGVF